MDQAAGSRALSSRVTPGCRERISTLLNRLPGDDTAGGQVVMIAAGRGRLEYHPCARTDMMKRRSSLRYLVG